MCVTADALGAPVAALVERCGMPQSVDSAGAWNHFVFAVDGGTADAAVGAETAKVHAIFVRGKAAAAAFSAHFTTSDGAIVHSFGSTRVYDAGNHRVFATLADGVTAGDLDTLVALRVLPGRINDPGIAQSYVEPRLLRGHRDDGSGERATVVRIDVDKDGIVRNVATIVPSSDPTFDASLAARFDDDRYAPATVMNRPVSGSVFREIRH